MLSTYSSVDTALIHDSLKYFSITVDLIIIDDYVDHKELQYDKKNSRDAISSH